MVLDSRTLEYLAVLNAVEHWRHAVCDARTFARDGRGTAARIQVWLEDEDTLPLIPYGDEDISWIPDDIEGTAFIGDADICILFVDPVRILGHTAEMVRYGRAVQRFAAERWPHPGCIFVRAKAEEASVFLEETDTSFLKSALVLADQQINIARIVSLLAASDLAMMPYAEYLKSHHWQSVRRDALARAKERCQLCNSRKKPLHTHHNSYERRGYEEPGDLIVLCASCHAKFHDKLPRGEA
jgi:hypothetical protein